jgi:hypothetical protein
LALLRSPLVAASTLALLGTPMAVGPAWASPTTETAPTATSAYAHAPCVHRSITWFCGTVASTPEPVATTTLQFDFGDSTDLPVFGDWNGDGNRTAAVFRLVTATWYLTNTDDASDPPQVLAYGNPGDKPLSGDWNGTGTETIGVYRPSNATFYLRYANTTGVADVAIPFGNRGDIPLAGDFDLTSTPGNIVTGTTRIGVYRPANQAFYFSHASGPVTSVVYGNPGDRPLAGSYYCAGIRPLIQTYAVFRPSNVTWYGLCIGGAHSGLPANLLYGNPSDVPLLK